MVERVRLIPGFVGVEDYAAEDGTELAVARFQTTEAIDAWREEPEHVRTRQRGREEFFSSYEITIATVRRQYGWSRDDEAPTTAGPAGALRVFAGQVETSLAP